MFVTHEQAGAVWLLRYRNPSEPDLGLVMQRVNEIAGGLPPSVTLWEKAYRQLFQEGAVSLVEAPMQISAARSHLTKSEYDRMSIHEIRQRYERDPDFRADVDELIKIGKVA